jgi:hypothetical protein
LVRGAKGKGKVLSMVETWDNPSSRDAAYSLVQDWLRNQNKYELTSREP